MPPANRAPAVRGWSRRSFLMGALGSALFSPFIRPLSGTSSAQVGGGVAKRVIVFFTPNGTVHSYWRPQGSGNTFSFAPGSILEPLAAFQDKLIVLDGIDFFDVANHEAGMANMLTGGGGANTLTGGKSLDQYLAAQVGTGDKFPSLTLGVQSDSGWGASNQTRMSYTAPGAFKAPIDSPSELYISMFGDPNASAGELDVLTQRRGLILDRVRNEVKLLQNAVGAEERIKLQAHLSALEEVEAGLQAPVGTCDAPGNIFSVNPLVNDNYPLVMRAQIDLLVTAMACGMTRVGSLQCGHTVGPHVFSWLGLSEGHHSLSHIDDSNPTGVAHFVEAERYLAEEFAYLLARLDSLPEPEGEGTLLDNTTVLWAQELGDGRLHDCHSVPFVLAGGAGGYFNTGQYLDFGGQPHQKLLVSVCQSMGLTNPTFGNPSFGTGPLEGLI